MFNGFINTKIPRTDIIHDKGMFLTQIMEQAAIYDSNKMNWKWVIADNPTDVVLFIKDLDMKRLMKCVRWALQSKAKELSNMFIHDQFVIRFVDGFHYNNIATRFPTEIEKGKELIRLMKIYLLENGHITTQQFRSEKGKLKKGELESTLIFIRNNRLGPIGSKISRDFKIVYDAYNAYAETKIEYKDSKIVYHIPTPVILGEIVVRIECDES